MNIESGKGDPPKDGRKFKYQKQDGVWITVFWDGYAFSCYGLYPYGGRLEGKPKDWMELPGMGECPDCGAIDCQTNH